MGQSHSCAGAINADCKKQSRSSLAEENFFNFEHPWKLSTNFSSPGRGSLRLTAPCPSFVDSLPRIHTRPLFKLSGKFISAALA